MEMIPVAIGICALLVIVFICLPIGISSAYKDTYLEVCDKLNWQPTERDHDQQFKIWYGAWQEDNHGKTFKEYVESLIKADQAAKQSEKAWLAGYEEISVTYFFKVRQENPQKLNFVGVYILHNTTADTYYVGQATHIGDRVNSHFTGKGNGDVYADWKYGSKFTIRLLPLNGSKYNSLDEFEKDMIAKFNAYEAGYNKTVGNN